MGPVWNRYGDSDGSLGEDWPRTLAHELGHFALFLEDNYLGLDANGKLVPVEGCPGAMSDPYRDDWSEFHPRRLPGSPSAARPCRSRSWAAPTGPRSPPTTRGSTPRPRTPAPPACRWP